eukprot:757339-Hanusia_phi.AAC.2
MSTSSEEEFVDGSVDESSGNIALLSRSCTVWMVDMFTGRKIRQVELDGRRGALSAICCLQGQLSLRDFLLTRSSGDQIMVGGAGGALLVFGKKASGMQEWVTVSAEKYMRRERVETGGGRARDRATQSEVAGDLAGSSRVWISKLIRCSHALLVVTDDMDLVVYETQRKHKIATQL